VWGRKGPLLRNEIFTTAIRVIKRHKPRKIKMGVFVSVRSAGKNIFDGGSILIGTEIFWGRKIYKIGKRIIKVASGRKVRRWLGEIAAK
jgi:hypothetical protein